MEGDRPDIKIFVSRRIDLDSIAIPNPLYVPVRCGAVFDKNVASPFLGDNTGDNISEKRMSFCEFTVQYWAWKNAQADYYGLCHYRRYLSFSEKTYQTEPHGLVLCPLLVPSAMKRYALLDVEAMREEIAQYDIIIPQGAPVSKMPLPHGKAKTVRELWEAHDGLFFEKKVIDRMFELIDAMAPEFSKSARTYFNGGVHRGYNCFIMHRELFDRLCRFQFPIMEEIERELDTADYTSEMLRTPAYIGEMLFGIFLQKVIEEEKWRVCEKQIVLFEETGTPKSKVAMFQKYIIHWLDRAIRKMAAPLFPLGSKRREYCKAIYHRLTGRERKR